MKYDSQIVELKNLLPTAKNILIALPADADMDRLAAGLALFLTLEAAGKEVAIVSETAVKVSQSHLFGVDHIQNNLPQTEGGNLTVTLEGVAASDGTVPALEKLDWYAEGSNLNLVFHVLSGQTFQPARIVPRYQGSGFGLIFVIGAVNLNVLGNIYQANNQVFSGVHTVNIDTQSANTSFGQTNIVDTNASSVSEVMTNLVADLGYSLDADSASNLLVGIFDITNNLSNAKASAETYMAVAQCLRVGGRKPGLQASQPQVAQPQTISQQPAYDWSALLPKEAMTMPKNEPQEYTTPPVVSPIDAGDHAPQAAVQPSPEERPAGERVISETPEPDWLTPKIFKGSSLG
ncbi:hypothetical protein HYS96_01320 [Candidatus Daviesbacteria bacterium]|nr:hypothetical protein [Candidatus Daviesbacteria bacterium]